MKRKRLVYLARAALSVSFLQPLLAEAAPNVIRDVPNVFSYMENSAADVLAYHQAVRDLAQAKTDLKQAERYLVQAENDRDQAAIALQNAKNAAQSARDRLTAARQQLAAAQQDAQAKTAAAIESQQAVADFIPVLYEAQGQEAALQAALQAAEPQGMGEPAGSGAAQGSRAARSPLAQRIAQAFAEVDYDSEYLDTVEQQIDAHQSVASGEGSDAAEGNAAALDGLQEQYDAASRHLDEVQDNYDALLDAQAQAEDEEADARQTVADLTRDEAEAAQDADSASQDAAEAEGYLTEAEGNLQQVRTDRLLAEKEQRTAQYSLDYWGEGRSLSQGMEFYSWQGTEHGHQFYLPYSFNSSDRHHHFDVSLNTGYISSHTGKENGSVSGWTDTTLSVSRLNPHPRYDVRYDFTVNIPTGQSRIFDNAVVPDDVAAFTRFGEGWNWTPGLEVTRHITDEDSLTWQASYSLRGSYAYSKDVPGSRIAPGNLANLELSYLHAGAASQLLGRLFLTEHVGETDENNLRYTEGRELGGEVYYERAFSARNAFAAYGGLSYTGANAYAEETLVPNSGIHRQYFGLGMLHRFDKQRRLRVFGTYMTANGASYDPLRNTYTDDRRRLTLLLGYEQQLNAREALSLYLERYVIQGSSTSDYNGWGARFLWNYNF